ncbi:TetR/AcrR family transcriptional regulator [Arcanobacterium haemolyticum]|nr:TetR/AcrR family transcriptional regulator [Arcanobacterium haemolyticum]
MSNAPLRKRENTRARLVEAAANVIAAKGFEGARIDDVVAEAGFTRGAFYSNYSSLDEVLTEALIMHGENLLDRVTQAVNSIDADMTVDTLMDLLDTIRPEARTIYLISTEYTLRRMRHPESPEVPQANREEFTRALSGIVVDVLTRMGRRASTKPDAIADVIALFFLDSIAKEAEGGVTPISGNTPHDTLRYMIEATITAMSEPM